MSLLTEAGHKEGPLASISRASAAPNSSELKATALPSIGLTEDGPAVTLTRFLKLQRSVWQRPWPYTALRDLNILPRLLRRWQETSPAFAGIKGFFFIPSFGIFSLKLEALLQPTTPLIKGGPTVIATGFLLPRSVWLRMWPYTALQDRNSFLHSLQQWMETSPASAGAEGCFFITALGVISFKLEALECPTLPLIFFFILDGA